MKVGDIVRANNKLLKMKHRGENRLLGTVVQVSDPNPRIAEKWRKHLGSVVDVLWSNGHLSERYAEGSLEVVENL